MRQAQTHPNKIDPNPTLSVCKISLNSFRNYRDLRLDMDPSIVLLTGANGSGKTNLLEAISLLVPGKGLRRAPLMDFQFQNSHIPWAVAIELHTPTGKLVIGTGREANDVDSERRIVQIDGRPCRSQLVLADHVAMTWITPEMDRILAEGPSSRRKFLDRLVYSFDPSHNGRIQRYEKSMRERLKLLRDGPMDTAWLSALEDEMAQSGVAIAAARLQLVRQLNQAMTLTDSAFPLANLTLQGMAEESLLNEPALLIEDALRAALYRTRSDDTASGTTSLGPHRTDLMVTHQVKETPAHYCSTGEQKALIITIILAYVRLLTTTRSMVPLLLLDDIAAHLDEARRAALFDELHYLRVQAWLTGTDYDAFEALPPKTHHLRVHDGRIMQV